MRVFALLAAVLVSVPAGAAERDLSLEHEGSVGLFLAAAPEYSALTLGDCVFCTGDRSIVGVNLVTDFGATIAVGGWGSELLLRFRYVSLSTAKGESVLFGYRKYFGRDEIKTFVGLDVQFTFRPVITLGARAGFGVMWDFSPIMGLWAEVDGSFGVGLGRRFGAELAIGFQARSYLLQ